MEPEILRRSVAFSTLYGALTSLLGVLRRPVCLSANQHACVGQALLGAGVPYRFVDVGWQGEALNDKAADELFLGTDYAGRLPGHCDDVVVWYNGAGFLDAQTGAKITVIDLTTLNPHAKAPGALVLCEDAALREALHRYAALGIEKAHLWNDKVRGPGVDALMAPLVREYWQANWEGFMEALRKTEAVTALYAERLGALKLVDTLDVRLPKVYPFMLAPELFCPKEDIYTAIEAAGIDITVPYKPLYRYDAFAGDTLPGTARYYNAVLALPAHDVDEGAARHIADAVCEIIERYAYRGCTF